MPNYLGLESKLIKVTAIYQNQVSGTTMQGGNMTLGLLKKVKLKKNAGKNSMIMQCQCLMLMVSHI